MEKETLLAFQNSLLAQTYCCLNGVSCQNDHACGRAGLSPGAERRARFAEVG